MRTKNTNFSSLLRITLTILALNHKVLSKLRPLISSKISIINAFRNRPFSKKHLKAKRNNASSIKGNTCGLATESRVDRNFQLQKPILAPLSGLARLWTGVILYGLNFRSLVAVWTDPSDKLDGAAKCIKEDIRLLHKTEPISLNLFLPMCSFFSYVQHWSFTIIFFQKTSIIYLLGSSKSVHFWWNLLRGLQQDE